MIVSPVSSLVNDRVNEVLFFTATINLSVNAIAANAITADKITTNNIAGTNGWINLRSGTFSYNDGALSWDGSTMKIGKFYITKTYLAAGSGSTCIGMCGDQAFWAGNGSSNSAPFRVSYGGKLVSTNADITGSVNATSIKAKEAYYIYRTEANDSQSIIRWTSGTDNLLSFGFSGSSDASINFRKGSKNVDVGGNLNVLMGELSVETISCTAGLNFITGSGKVSISGSGGLTVSGDLRFIDYEQSDSGNNANRRPVASVTADGSRVAYLSSAVKNSKHSLYVKGQYGKTGNNYSGYYFYNDATSDIRLKENIGVCNVNALSAINKMNICSFDWKEEKNHQSLGLIADELEKIDPMLTLGGGYDSNGSMNVKCIDRLLLTEYAIKGIQELYEQYKLQKKEIQKLKKEIQKLK